jgi:enolase
LFPPGHQPEKKKRGIEGRRQTRYGGKGVTKAVNNVNKSIRTAVTGLDASDQPTVDAAMLALGGPPNKAKLGANAVLAVSMAVAYLPMDSRSTGGSANACILLVQRGNVINGASTPTTRWTFRSS